MRYKRGEGDSFFTKEDKLKYHLQKRKEEKR